MAKICNQIMDKHNTGFRFETYISSANFLSSCLKRREVHAFWIRSGHNLQIAPPKEFSTQHLKKQEWLNLASFNDMVVRKNTAQVRNCPSISRVAKFSKIPKIRVINAIYLACLKSFSKTWSLTFSQWPKWPFCQCKTCLQFSTLPLSAEIEHYDSIKRKIKSRILVRKWNIYANS